MLFKSVIGQNGVRDQLIRAAKENRVSHALLFHGPSGCGKFPLALAFAQYLNCEDPGKEDSCGVCRSCLKAQKNIHPDIHFVYPVVNGLKVLTPVSDDFIDEWREYLKTTDYPVLQGWLSHIKVENKQAGIFKKEAEAILHKLHFKAFESDYKLVIIWLPEKMNPTAANKLLKIIEEPPEKTVFLMVAESTEEILPTILSRTQLIRINKIPEEALYLHLTEKFPDQKDIVQGLVRLADGNYPEAITLIESNEQNRYFLEQFIKWMRMTYGFKVSELLEWVPSIAKIGRERQKDFLVFCLRMVQGNFHMNRNLRSIMRLSLEEQGFSEKFNNFINPGNIEGLNKLFSEAISHVSMNANPKILFMDMSTQLYRLLRKPSEQ